MQTILHFTDIEPLRELAQWYGFVDKSDMIGDQTIKVRLHAKQPWLEADPPSVENSLYGYINEHDANLALEYEDGPFSKLVEVYRNLTGRTSEYPSSSVIVKKAKLDKVRLFMRNCNQTAERALLCSPQQPTSPQQAPTGKGATTVPPAPAATQPNPVIAQPVPYRFTPANASKYPHYFKAVNQTHIDIYWVLDHFNTGSSALDHAVKKLLVPGGRGAKDRLTDLKEALASLNSAIEALENQQ